MLKGCDGATNKSICVYAIELFNCEKEMLAKQLPSGKI